MNWDNFFTLSWRKLWIVIVTGFVSILLHNAFSATFSTQEPFFFSIVVILIPTYFIISIIFTVIVYFKNKQKRK